MILDALLEFDPTGTSVAIAAGTQASTNVIDLHGTGLIPVLANLQGARDIGIGDDPALKLLVQVTAAFVSAGGATLQVALQGAPDNGSAVAGTFVTLWTSPAYTIAQLVAGARLYDMDMPRPPDGVVIPRFLRMAWIIGTSTMSAGTVQSYIVLDRPDQYYSSTNNAVLGGYPAGINIAN